MTVALLCVPISLTGNTLRWNKPSLPPQKKERETKVQFCSVLRGLCWEAAKLFLLPQYSFLLLSLEGKDSIISLLHKDERISVRRRRWRGVCVCICSCSLDIFGKEWTYGQRVLFDSRSHDSSGV